MLLNLKFLVCGIKWISECIKFSFLSSFLKVNLNLKRSFDEKLGVKIFFQLINILVSCNKPFDEWRVEMPERGDRLRPEVVWVQLRLVWRFPDTLRPDAVGRLATRTSPLERRSSLRRTPSRSFDPVWRLGSV